MYNYFTNPFTLFKEQNTMAECNPKSCESSKSNLSVSSMTENVVVDKANHLPQFSQAEMENEVWKQIRGFENYYISNLGRIFSKCSNRILRPCNSPSMRKSKSFELVVSLYDFCTTLENGKNKQFNFSLSQLVAKHFLHIPKSLQTIKKLCLLHKNGNQFDNRADNLCWVSRCYLDNRYKNETKPFGNTPYIDIDTETKWIAFQVKNGIINDIQVISETENGITFLCKSALDLAKYYPIGISQFYKYVIENNNNDYKN